MAVKVSLQSSELLSNTKSLSGHSAFGRCFLGINLAWTGLSKKDGCDTAQSSARWALGKVGLTSVSRHRICERHEKPQGLLNGEHGSSLPS